MTSTRTARAFACLAACMLFVAAAQAAAPRPASVAKGFGFAYDPAKEITVVGTVAQVVTQPAHGSPMGMHLLISSSGKEVDAHVGSRHLGARECDQVAAVEAIIRERD